MAYQDRWIAGAKTESGDRTCADRYALIRSVVETYRRQITVWDLGANLGYFGCRIAEEFGAVCAMVDQRPVLADVCRQNAIPTTIAMTHRLTANDLIELARSEHADVVLALNVLHHMPDWRQALPAVLALGETVIVETPGRGDVRSANYDESQAILDALEAYGPALLGTSSSHVTPGIQRPMLTFTNAKPSVSAGYAYGGKVRARGPHPARSHVITSTSHQKSVRFSDGESREWFPGINLWNWLQMDGSYPDRSTVQQAAIVAAAGLPEAHGDFRPWNLVLQGQFAQVIDAGHRRSVDDARGLAETVAWIAEPELAYAH